MASGTRTDTARRLAIGSGGRALGGRAGARALLGAGWTSLVTLVVLLLATWHHAAFNRFTRITDFIELGHRFARPMGLDALATSPVGYDGQYYYFIARFPGWQPPGAFVLPALYHSRILYPLLARLLAFGQPVAIPWTMLGINLAAIVGAVTLLSALLRERGLPRWPALAVGLYCGQPLALFRDLTDPLMIFWLVLALWAAQRGRWLLVAAALGFGMLTRESTLPFALCLALPLILARRWRLLAVYAAIILLPYAAWQVCIHLMFGMFGLGQSTQVNTFVPLPFAGLAAAPSGGVAVSMLLLTGVPAVGTLALGLRALWTRPWGDPLLLAAAVAGCLYSVLFMLQPGVHWLDFWEPTRLAAPCAALAPLLLAARGARRPRHYAIPALMIASVLLAFVY